MRCVLAILALAVPAYADGDKPDSSSATDPHLVGDVRFMMLVRTDDNYFVHTSRFNYDFPQTAGGVLMSLGVALTPRLSLLGEGFYVVDGADRGDARLRLSSGALLGLARGALARFSEKDVTGEIALSGGFGRYYIKETYVDPSLSPMVFHASDGSFGGVGSIEASITTSAFRAVIAYGYHYAPASISDRVRGSVDAGGHEISIGVGVRL